jgi:hypothetical protein
VESRGAVGSATINNVAIIHPKTSGCKNEATAFNLIRGSGNQGLEESQGPAADVVAARRASVEQ